jgi:enoyl-CoA hydratase
MPVSYDKQGHVAVLTMDDGKANAITRGVVDEFNGHLDAIDSDGDVRAVMIAGRPGRFSAGFDLSAMTGSQASMMDLVMSGGRLAARLLLQPHPVVVACTGHALAMGAILLLAGDHRIGAAGDWKIGLNEVAIGMPMPRWGVELARDRLAPTQLEWRLLLGQTGGPDEAVAAGFLDRVVAPDELLGQAMETATRLAELRSAAVAGTKQRLRGGLVDRMLHDMERDLQGVSVPQAG